LEFLCPIKYEIMNDPVIASDDITYERAAITIWLQDNKTSPITGNIMIDNNLTSNDKLLIKISS